MVYKDTPHVQSVELTWEWDSQYKLRSTFYVIILAIPLKVLRVLGLDTNYAVDVYPYIFHNLLVILSDYYYLLAGQKILGNRALYMTLPLYLTNRQYNMVLIRCFSNSIESIFAIIALYKVIMIDQSKGVRCRSMKQFYQILMVSAMMRVTSVIGWIPIVLY